MVAESLQCGTPVIISDRVGAKDFVSQDSGIVVEKITPEAIAHAILQAVDQRFAIAKDFAVQYGLTLEQHIDKLRALKKQ